MTPDHFQNRKSSKFPENRVRSSLVRLGLHQIVHVDFERPDLEIAAMGKAKIFRVVYIHIDLHFKRGLVLQTILSIFAEKKPLDFEILTVSLPTCYLVFH